MPTETKAPATATENQPRMLPVIASKRGFESTAYSFTVPKSLGDEIDKHLGSNPDKYGRVAGPNDLSKVQGLFFQHLAMAALNVTLPPGLMVPNGVRTTRDAVMAAAITSVQGMRERFERAWRIGHNNNAASPQVMRQAVADYVAKRATEGIKPWDTAKIANYVKAIDVVFRDAPVQPEPATSK